MVLFCETCQKVLLPTGTILTKTDAHYDYNRPYRLRRERMNDGYVEQSVR